MAQLSTVSKFDKHSSGREAALYSARELESLRAKGGGRDPAASLSCAQARTVLRMTKPRPNRSKRCQQNVLRAPAAQACILTPSAPASHLSRNLRRALCNKGTRCAGSGPDLTGRAVGPTVGRRLVDKFMQVPSRPGALAKKPKTWMTASCGKKSQAFLTAVSARSKALAREARQHGVADLAVAHPRLRNTSDMAAGSQSRALGMEWWKRLERT